MKTSLRGHAASALLAAAIAAGVAGCNKAQDPAGTPAASVGAGIDDGLLSARVAAALLADLSTRSYGFKVETRQGRIELSGYGQSQADIARAIELARAVPGVKSVDNKASVKSVDATTVGSTIDDGIVTARVKTALLADSSVRGLQIGVETQKGEVRLSGAVENAEQKERAGTVARGVDGVRTVSNQLSVKQ